MQKNSLNKYIGIGRLGKKPEIKYTQNQMAICNFSIATTESFKKNDAYEDKTEWIKCVVFGKTAEFMGNYLDKGAMVYVEGRLQTSSWEKEGVKHYKTEVVAYTVTPLGSKSDASTPPSTQTPPAPGEDDEPPF